jgi:hypothetical protein
MTCIELLYIIRFVRVRSNCNGCHGVTAKHVKA